MKKFKVIAWIAVFLLSAAIVGYSIQGRKLAQMVADGEFAWDVLTDIGYTGTVTELNLLNMGTDAVSDTGLHLQYVTDKLDWAVTDATVRKVVFTKPSDMTVKVIGISVGIDTCATLGVADTSTLNVSFIRFDASDTTFDSLCVANLIQIDSLTNVHTISTPTLSSATTLDDGDLIEIYMTCSNSAVTTQATANATIELYIKPE